MGAAISSYVGYGPSKEHALLSLAFALIIERNCTISRCGWYRTDFERKHEYYAALYVDGDGWYFIDFSRHVRGYKAHIVVRSWEDAAFFRPGNIYDFARDQWIGGESDFDDIYYSQEPIHLEYGS